jgi:hypothetical protein
MGLTVKEKGKAAMARSIADITFSTDMGALDYEPSREEETFLQLIGLDRFITRVTWEIMNTRVIQEVITNLNVDTMETRLNGHKIPIFSKGWRQTMKAVFFLNTFIAKREPGTPRVHASDIFPNIKEKMKTKSGTCKINDRTIPEARRPLKFFNSLFLLRTSANTIACTGVVHLQDALNGREVDWPALFYGYIKAELVTLKEALYKDKTTTLRTLVGPPLTMILISEGLLTVPQEIEAGILMPSELIEEPSSKKRKTQPAMELTTGETSKTKEPPQILVAMAEPAMPKPKPPPTIIIDLGEPSHDKQNIAKPVSTAMEPKINKSVLISTMGSGTSKVDFEPLSNILQRFRDTTQLLENWISVTKLSPNSPQHSHPLNTDVQKFNQSTFGLQLQVPTLQLHYASATIQSDIPAATSHTPSTEVRSRGKTLHNKAEPDQSQNPAIPMELPSQQPKTLEQNHKDIKARDYLQKKMADRNIIPENSSESLQAAAANGHAEKEDQRQSQPKSTTLQTEYNNTTQQFMFRQGAATTARKREPLQNTGAAESRAEIDERAQKNPAADPSSKYQQSGCDISEDRHRNAAATTNITLQEENHRLQNQIKLLQTKYAATTDRNYQIEEDNKQKSIVYTQALEQIHQLTEENQRLRTKGDPADEHRTNGTLQTQQVTDLQKQNQELRIQLENLKSQHAAALSTN